jgi:hypothetical protein
VLFYKTFSTSFNYTPRERIDDPSKLTTALAVKDAAVTFDLE